LAGVLALGLAVSGTAAADAAPTPQALPAAPPVAAAAATATNSSRDVIANLWEWNWPSIARECTTVLGPKGYGGVQVAPPTDSTKRTELGNGSDTVLNPWWEVYQPVRYALTSRMGNEAQFRQMVSTCRAAGVKVYVDAVINHMAAQGTTSYGGVAHERYRYTQVPYRPNNFHKYSGDCPSSTGGIEDFNAVTQVWNCELVELPDLRTETRYVRTQVVRYLNKLLGYGVSGFRVDAAKHMPQADLIAIRNRLTNTVDGERPYWALEVIPGGPGVLTPWAYARAGSLLGFDYARQVKDAFKSYTKDATGSIASLRVFGEDAGLLPSEQSTVFIQNHDTERGNEVVTYKDGKTNIIAHQFMLAYPYGRPQVYSSFEFGADTAQSPPSDANGFVTDTNCASGWTCVNRLTPVANLVGFRNYVGEARLRNWYDDGANVISFSRGNRGWIAINNGTAPVRRRFQTGLRRGTYCDISRGNYRAGTCTGPTVRVNARGRASVTVGAKEAVAFAANNLVR
jgi:alpha-amylase